MIDPFARSFGPAGFVGSATSTITWSSSADCIWLATARFHTSSYSRPCSALRKPISSSRVRDTSVGRTASCASCAFFALAWYSRGASGVYCSPNPVATYPRMPSIASRAIETPSVRM